MKKLSVIIICLILVLSISSTAFAENELQDGIYEVNITLLHAEKEKTSMGNDYISQIALLEVENGKKTLVMVQSKEVSNLQFWYYLDGSVEGETASVSVRKNVCVNGKLYSDGYAFPLVNGGNTFGVKFKASIMPMTPSARVRIDFDSLKAIKTEQADIQTTVDTSPVNQTLTTEIIIAQTILQAEITAVETTSYVETKLSSVQSETQLPENTSDNSLKSIIAIISLIAIVIIFFVIKKKNKA